MSHPLTTSPQIDAMHLDCNSTIGRLERELARVIRENEHLRQRHGEILGRCNELLFEARACNREVEQLRREIAHLRHRDDHLTFGGGQIGTGPIVGGQMGIGAHEDT